MTLLLLAWLGVSLFIVLLICVQSLIEQIRPRARNAATAANTSPLE